MKINSSGYQPRQAVEGLARLAAPALATYDARRRAAAPNIGRQHGFGNQE
jgi:hypothetical protein